MQERRKYFRHLFGDSGLPDVKLWTTSRNVSFEGRLMDLSLGGARIAVDIFGPQPQPNSLLWASFSTPTGPLDFHCQVKHHRVNGPAGILGLVFLPLVDEKSNASREQKLWRFLLHIQRIAAQERRGATPATLHEGKALRATLHDGFRPEPTRPTLHEGSPPPAFE